MSVPRGTKAYGIGSKLLYKRTHSPGLRLSIPFGVTLPSGVTANPKRVTILLVGILTTPTTPGGAQKRVL